MYTYWMILDLKSADSKVEKLATQIQRMEKERTELNRGELLFTIVLYSIQL